MQLLNVLAAAARLGLDAGDVALTATGAVTARSCMYQFSSLPRFLTHTNLSKALLHFKSGESHLGLVYERTGEHIVGIFTMAALTEAVLGSRIPDEKEYRRARIIRHGPAYASNAEAARYQGARAPALEAIVPTSPARRGRTVESALVPPQSPAQSAISDDPREPLLGKPSGFAGI